MCVGSLVTEPTTPIRNLSNVRLEKREASNVVGIAVTAAHEERKEKSRNAARHRRAQESDYFQDLEEMLPISGPPPNSQMTSIDKTSLIRLTVSHLKTRDVITHGGIKIPQVKEEVQPEIDILDTLDGFSIILSEEGDVIHVSHTVTNYIGLSAFELLGSNLSEFVHPCDHTELNKLHPQDAENEDKFVEIYIRVKCTITERGRMINLKQANYKALKLSGRARHMAKREEGGVNGVIFMGVGSLVSWDQGLEPNNAGVFTTRQSADMKLTEVEGWLTDVGHYAANKLTGVSFFQLVHAEDIQNIMPAFKNLKESGHCETVPYRLLVGGGGYAWVLTKSSISSPRRGSNKGQSVTSRHYLITEVERKGEVFSLIQKDAFNANPSAGSSKKRVGTRQKSQPHVQPPEQKEKKPSFNELVDKERDYTEVLAMLAQDAKELRKKQVEKTAGQAQDADAKQIVLKEEISMSPYVVEDEDPAIPDIDLDVKPALDIKPLITMDVVNEGTSNPTSQPTSVIVQNTSMAVFNADAMLRNSQQLQEIDMNGRAGDNKDEDSLDFFAEAISDDFIQTLTPCSIITDLGNEADFGDINVMEGGKDGLDRTISESATADLFGEKATDELGSGSAFGSDFTGDVDTFPSQRNSLTASLFTADEAQGPVQPPADDIPAISVEMKETADYAASKDNINNISLSDEEDFMKLLFGNTSKTETDMEKFAPYMDNGECVTFGKTSAKGDEQKDPVGGTSDKEVEALTASAAQLTNLNKSAPSAVGAKELEALDLDLFGEFDFFDSPILANESAASVMNNSSTEDGIIIGSENVSPFPREIQLTQDSLSTEDASNMMRVGQETPPGDAIAKAALVMPERDIMWGQMDQALLQEVAAFSGFMGADPEFSAMTKEPTRAAAPYVAQPERAFPERKVSVICNGRDLRCNDMNDRWSNVGAQQQPVAWREPKGQQLFLREAAVGQQACNCGQGVYRDSEQCARLECRLHKAGSAQRKSLLMDLLTGTEKDYLNKRKRRRIDVNDPAVAEVMYQESLRLNASLGKRMRQNEFGGLEPWRHLGQDIQLASPMAFAYNN